MMTQEQQERFCSSSSSSSQVINKHKMEAPPPLPMFILRCFKCSTAKSAAYCLSFLAEEKRGFIDEKGGKGGG
jgi:hypothetical protein